MMIVMAMLLGAVAYPVFDANKTARLCTAKRADKIWATVYETNESCIADQKVDYRRFMIVANADDGTLAESFRTCVTNWTRDTLTDWGQVRLCAVDNVDGKRDVGLLRTAAPRSVRPAIDKCLTDASSEGPPDWDDVVSCARDQISAARDFNLFQAAAASDGDRRAVDLCTPTSRDRDQGIDWEDVLRCAIDGGLKPDAPD